MFIGARFWILRSKADTVEEFDIDIYANIPV